MVRITVELVRKKAEHHDRCLAPLEEISLHQENIEKIEYIQDWCPKLQILLLQSNLIAKIENLNKMKHLDYLNLAINNIEVIENLERCESLRKLDLTLNFVGKLTSVETLKGNYNLRILYLTGNPCCDYDNYREFVIGTLPQLEHLDGKDIERSDRIVALRKVVDIRPDIVFEQNVYKGARMKQKERLEKKINDRFARIDETLDSDELTKKFWEEKCENAPEVRVEIEKFKELKLKRYDEPTKKKEEKRERKLFRDDGKAFNINEPKIPFHLDDTDPSKIVLDLQVYKHLETGLIDADVNPDYVRVTIKGKIFQASLPDEIDVSKSTAKRSEITGHLVIAMPKINYIGREAIIKPKEKHDIPKKVEACNSEIMSNRREFLEIGSSRDKVLDLTMMTKQCDKLYERKRIKPKERSAEFIDNPEVPPLL